MSDRLIKVQGHGNATEPPDYVGISFYLRTKDFQYQEALRLLEQKYQTVQEQMKKAEVSRKEMTTTRFDVNTVFVTKQKQQVFDGYVASHSLRLEIPWEKDRLALILQKLMEVIDGVEFRLSFFVKDSTALRKKALEEAVRRAKENATTIARASDVKLGEIVSIDYGWAEVRFESDFMLSERAATSGPDINPEAIDHSESVTMTWLIAG